MLTMNIALRNQDIVSRAVKRETFAAIGRDHGLSRERVRQIFMRHATREQVKIVNTAMPKQPKHDDEKPFTDLPRNVKKKRLHLLLPAATGLEQCEIRDGIRAWLSGKLKIQIETKSPDMGPRIDLTMALEMDSKLRNKCDKMGLKVSPVVRAIIVAMENSK